MGLIDDSHPKNGLLIIITANIKWTASQSSKPYLLVTNGLEIEKQNNKGVQLLHSYTTKPGLIVWTRQ